MLEAEFLLGIPGTQPGLEKVPVEQADPSSALAGQSAESAVMAAAGCFLECCHHGCGSVGDVPGAWLASAPLWPSLWT